MVGLSEEAASDAVPDAANFTLDAADFTLDAADSANAAALTLDAADSANAAAATDQATAAIEDVSKESSFLLPSIFSSALVATSVAFVLEPTPLGPNPPLIDPVSTAL